METKSITLNIYEAIMNKETIKFLPALVEDMDENLAIHIDTFVNNQLIKPFNLNPKEVIQIVKGSKRYHYDTKTKTLKFKKKADQNVIIVDNFEAPPVENELEEITKIKFLKNSLLLSTKQQLENHTYHHFLNKLKKIEKVNENFHLVFENEDYASEAKEFFQTLNKEGHFKTELKMTQAAESLKRRVVSEYPCDLPTLKQQNSLVGALFKNPVKFIPRRFTVNVNPAERRKSFSSNKYERIPLDLQSMHKFTGEIIPEDQIRPGNRVVARNTMIDNDRYNYLLGQFSLNQRGSVDLPKRIASLNRRSSAQKSFSKNKFDIAEEQNNSNEEISKIRQSYVQVQGLRKFSKGDELMKKNIEQSAQMYKDYKEGLKKLSMVHPRNYDYMSLKHNPQRRNLDFNASAPTDEKIKFRYNVKELFSVFHHLQILKNFEMPNGIKDYNFFTEIFCDNPKESLDQLKPGNKKEQGNGNRGRTQTGK